MGFSISKVLGEVALEEFEYNPLYYKVKAYANIDENEGDKLVKDGTIKEYRFVAKSFEFAHSTPYHFQKDL